MAKETSGLRLLLIYGASVGLMVSLYSHLTAPWLREQGFTPAVIGTLMALTTFISAIANLTGGFLADSVGRRSTLALGQIAVLAGIVLFITTQTLGAVIITMVLWGLFSLGQPGLNALVADSAHSSNRGAHFGGINALTMLTAMLGPILGGALANHYSPLAAYFVALIPGTLGLLLVCQLPNQAQKIGHGIKRPSLGPKTLGFVFLFFILGLEMGLIRPVQGLLLIDRFNTSWGGLGLVTALTTLASALAALLGGFVSDKVGRSKILLLCLLPAAWLVSFLPITVRIHHAATVLFIYNLLGSAYWPALAAMGMEAVEPGARARFAGITSTALNLGAVLGSAWSGTLYSVAQWLPFTMAGLIIILTLLPVTWYLAPDKGADVVITSFRFIYFKVR